jgi:mannose-6-phosphate isomerase-like protein (cupin superfamily)
MLLASSIAAARAALRTRTDDYVVLFEHRSLEAGYYRPRRVDEQTPHRRDEVYVVIAGTGRFDCGGESTSFEPGTVLFAAAGVEHRFADFSEDFATWVFFYGPDGGEQAASARR